MGSLLGMRHNCYDNSQQWRSLSVYTRNIVFVTRLFRVNNSPILVSKFMVSSMS